MVAKTVDEVQEVVEIRTPAPKIALSPEVAQKAQTLLDNLIIDLKGKTQAYAERKTQPEIGPQIAGYPYWNCLTVGPITFANNPPYLPHKIIPAGVDSWMLGLVWVNQNIGPGGTFPASVVLGGRDYRVRFETINLSTVMDGPDQTYNVTFGSPADEFTPFWWKIPTDDPGVNPALMEVTMTVDLTLGGQPLATFNTWHYDLDEESPFGDRPYQSPHWQFERSARFMIYRP